MRFPILCLIILSQFQLLAQDIDPADANALESELLFYADVMINTFESSTRQRAAEEFEMLFEEYLSSGKAFQKEAAFHKYISVLDAPDDKFKLITWIKRVDDATSDYAGYLYFKNGKSTKLKRTDIVSEDLVYTSCTADSWYGCYYYRIMKSGKDYLVFGMDINGKYDNQKIVDILSIDNEKVRFGKEVFEDKEEAGTYLNRIVLRFSSDASVYLNYDPKMKKIVHDHLEPRMGLQPGQGPTNIPDGTYEGYELKKGKWKYDKKLFHHVYKTAPFPKPVKFREDPKDIKN